MQDSKWTDPYDLGCFIILVALALVIAGPTLVAIITALGG